MNVNLRWAANTEPDLDHYELHYGRQPGVYTGLVATPSPEAEASIQNLRNGVWWYFAVKAVDTAGNASAFSNEVSKINRLVRVR